MSVETQIARLLAARNKIRNKLVNLGLATSVDKIETLADSVDGIVNNGAVNVEVREGESYTVPAGFHNGGGVVKGVAGGGSYTLQEKSVTPTKQQQSVSSDAGYYGLSSVTVGAIPDAYQDVSSVTANAADVLANKVIVKSDGTVTAGTMPNNGAVSATLDVVTNTYTVPAGYHNGSGVVRIVRDSVKLTPTKEEQSYVPPRGKVLMSVFVDPIPDNFGDVSETDLGIDVSDYILEGLAVLMQDEDGNAMTVVGTMADNDGNAEFDALSQTSVELPEGYYGGGINIVLTSDLEEALAAI